MKPSGLCIALYHGFESRFIDWQDSFFQILNFLPVNVYAGNMSSHFCETGSGNKSYVPGTNNNYIHKALVL